MTSILVSPSVRHVRNQRQLPRALDGRLQPPLVRRAHARDPPRQDLAAIRHERRQHPHVLVVDVVDLLDAELAELAAPEQRPALPRAPLGPAAPSTATSWPPALARPPLFVRHVSTPPPL